MQTFCATNIRIVTRIPRQAQPSQALFSMHRAKQKSCDDKYDSYCQRLTSNRRESAPTIPGRNFPTCASTGTLRASRSDRATSRDRFSWIPDAANRRGEVLVRPHSYTGLVIRFYAQVSSCTVSIAPCGAGCDSHRATSPPRSERVNRVRHIGARHREHNGRCEGVLLKGLPLPQPSLGAQALEHRPLVSPEAAPPQRCRFSFRLRWWYLHPQRVMV